MPPKIMVKFTTESIKKYIQLCYQFNIIMKMMINIFHTSKMEHIKAKALTKQNNKQFPAEITDFFHLLKKRGRKVPLARERMFSCSDSYYLLYL